MAMVKTNHGCGKQLVSHLNLFGFGPGLRISLHIAVAELKISSAYVNFIQCRLHQFCLPFTLLLLLFAGTIFCEFLRFGKNCKIKYPQNFLPTHIWHCGDGWPLLERMLIILFWSFLPFLFFFPVPSWAWESDVFLCRSWEFHEQNLNFILDG